VRDGDRAQIVNRCFRCDEAEASRTQEVLERVRMLFAPLPKGRGVASMVLARGESITQKTGLAFPSGTSRKVDSQQFQAAWHEAGQHGRFKRDLWECVTR
jgi:hypothetical protein